ncbi:unnamed protein product [Macrosiphum euphorbiae]|nr:unnamed protein product [Macrosiphum euphorbiae]
MPPWLIILPRYSELIHLVKYKYNRLPAWILIQRNQSEIISSERTHVIPRTREEQTAVISHNSYAVEYSRFGNWQHVATRTW